MLTVTMHSAGVDHYRYVKRRRNMPQTEWHDPRTGQRIGGVSLAEHLAALLLPAYDATGYKFISGASDHIGSSFLV